MCLSALRVAKELALSVVVETFIFIFVVAPAIHVHVVVVFPHCIFTYLSWLQHTASTLYSVFSSSLLQLYNIIYFTSFTVAAYFFIACIPKLH
jgi:hypothetical protein